MITQEAAEELVATYIRLWHDAWQSLRERYQNDEFDFADWAALVEALDGVHFVPGANSGSAGSYGTPATHDPAIERIVAFASDGRDAARVETQGKNVVTSYWEYEIVAHAGAPKLKKIRRYFDAKGTPVVDAVAAAQILAVPTPDAPLGELERGFDPNGDALFESGREVTLGAEKATIEVRSLGELVTKTGVLSVIDFGYDARGMAPFTRRLSPGAYPVDACIVGGRVAALRVRISDAPVARWHAARFGSGGHVVGVDAANVALFDVGAFVQLDAWTKERLFETYVDLDRRPIASSMTLRDAGDGVIVETGFGDGAYPCYWGVDANGDIARLFIDFLMLGDFLEESCTIAWTGGNIVHPLLSEWGVELEIDGAELVVRGGAFKHAIVTQGEATLDTRRAGLRVRGDERRHDFEEDLEPPLAIQVTLTTGFRNP